MRVTVLEEVPEDPQIAAAWNDLALEMERPEVFYTQQWALAAARAFTGDDPRRSDGPSDNSVGPNSPIPDLANRLRPLVLLVYESEKLCGVGALATAMDSRTSAFFLTASTADYCDILSRPEQRGAVLTALFAELRRLGVRDLALANIPSESATLRQLPATGGAHGFRSYARHAYECGVILFGGDGERQTLLESMKRKDREKRGLKKLAQMGSVQVNHATANVTEAELAPIVNAHITRFLATHRVSPLVRRDRRFFLSELSRLLGQEDWLKISQLEIDGAPISWNYGFRFGDSWFWYLPTFQIRYEEFSPGSCLLRLLIEEACNDRSVRRLDMGLGDEAYKARFASSANRTSYVRVTSSRTRHVATVGLDGLTSQVKKSPALETRLRDARDGLARLRARIRETGVAATAGYALGRTVHRIASEDEILLFEAPPGVGATESDAGGVAAAAEVAAGVGPIAGSLIALDWGHLAEAAILYAGDPETLQYLMRAAERLRRGGGDGFVLQAGDTPFAHILWIGNFVGFHLSEIDHKLEAADSQFGAPGPADPEGAFNAAMIFDCWTPAVHRGKSYYSQAIRLAAASLDATRRRAWIFGAAANKASIRGIVRAGFLYRGSILRRRRWIQSSIRTMKRETLARLR